MGGGLTLNWWYHFAGASSILFVVGVIDDVRGMKPLVKLAGQMLAAAFMAFSGAHFGPLLGHEMPLWLDHILVVFWIVAIINAFNLIDGLDGLASGLAIISAFGLGGILLLQGAPSDVLVLLGFIGACLGFLRYNFHPATIFLGDTGSMFIGFTLGVIALQTFNKNSFLISLTIPMLVLGVPIYDAVLAIWRRSVRKWVDPAPGGVKRGIMQPDVEHLHHRLRTSGLSTGRVALYLCILNGGLVLVGLAIALFQSHAAGIFLIALMAGAYVLMRHLAVIELRETGRALLTGLHRPTHSTLKALAHPFGDMLALAGTLALEMWIVGQHNVPFWRAWYLDLPVWVTPTFSILAITRAYVTYWPRARLRDLLAVELWLIIGMLVSLALALVIDPSQEYQSFLRALLLASISHPLIIGSRLFYPTLEEFMIWLRRHGEAPPGAERERVLLYGAGTRAQLFLSEFLAKDFSSPGRRYIVGLLDDEKTLHFQWIYGLLVLGGVQELPYLIDKHKIVRVIMVANLRPENRQALLAVAGQKGIHISDWYAEEHEVPPVPDAINSSTKYA